MIYGVSQIYTTKLRGFNLNLKREKKCKNIMYQTLCYSVIRIINRNNATKNNFQFHQARCRRIMELTTV